MSQWIKQSTAFTFRIGPFLDDTDGKTAETGLTIAQADIQISKNGAAFAQTSAASPTTTHDVDGWYQCPLTTTDTNTLGTLEVQIVMAGALPVWKSFMVVPANVWDSMFGADKLQVDAVEVSSDSTAADNLEAACDGTTYNLGGGAVVAASVTGAVGSVTGAVGSVTGAVGSVTGNVGGNVAGSVASVTGAVGSVTGNVGGSVAGSVGSVTGAVGSVTGAVGSVSGSVGSVVGAVTVGTINAGAINAAAIGPSAIDADALAADAVAEIQSGLATAASVSGLNNLSAAQVNAEVVDVLRVDTIPDSYATDGAQPTIAQAILGILQFLSERGVSGTTVTVRKPDGSTTAMTFTLNDASSPTSITRAS